MVQHLPRRHKALASNPSISENSRKGEMMGWGQGGRVGVREWGRGKTRGIGRVERKVRRKGKDGKEEQRE